VCFENIQAAESKKKNLQSVKKEILTNISKQSSLEILSQKKKP